MSCLGFRNFGQSNSQPRSFSSIFTDCAKDNICITFSAQRARREVSSLFHAIEKGQLKEEKETSSLFHAIEKEPRNQNGDRYKSDAQGIVRIITAYNEEVLYNKEKKGSKEIHTKTQKLLEDLLKKAANTDQVKTEAQFKIMLKKGSRVVNAIDETSLKEDLDSYFVACKEFIKLLIPVLQKESDINETLNHIFNSLKKITLLLAYLPRSQLQKHVGIIIRRLMPIIRYGGYILIDYLLPCLATTVSIAGTGGWIVPVVISLILMSILCEFGMEILNKILDYCILNKIEKDAEEHVNNILTKLGIKIDIQDFETFYTKIKLWFSEFNQDFLINSLLGLSIWTPLDHFYTWLYEIILIKIPEGLTEIFAGAADLVVGIALVTLGEIINASIHEWRQENQLVSL